MHECVHGCESAVFTVCLVCLRRQAQVLRRRYSSRSVQAVEFESVNTVKTVERSNRKKCFSAVFFPGLRSGLPRLRNAGASPDVAQRSNCQGVPCGRRGSMRSINSRGIVSKSEHDQCIARRAAAVHRACRPASIDAH